MILPRPLPQPGAARIRICRSFLFLRVPVGIGWTGAALGGEPAFDAHVAAAVPAGAVDEVGARLADVEPAVVGCLVHDRHAGEDPRVRGLSKAFELVKDVHLYLGTCLLQVIRYFVGSLSGDGVPQ